VPFDSASRNDTLVTATHAVFHRDNGRFAPAAVVGFQFQLTAMQALFKNVTNGSCLQDNFECFILDDNGFVIVSSHLEYKLEDTGRFFGEVRGLAMRRMIDEGIYQAVTVYDYQAICFINKDSASLASRLITVSCCVANGGCSNSITLFYLLSAIQVHVEAL
jgi:hypothetical protein